MKIPNIPNIPRIPKIPFFYIQNPKMLLLVLPLLVLLFILMRFRFVSFKTKEELENFIKGKRAMRIFIMVMRSLIIISLVIALASPFYYEVKETKGNPFLSILTDNSTSFSLFEQDIAEGIAEKLEGKIPIEIKNIAYGESSPIADNIIMNIKGDDNLLLITDGNSYGKFSLGDVLTLALMTNTTINMIDAPLLYDDSLVKINGPRETIVGTDYEFDVIVEQTRDTPFKLKVYLDNRLIMEKELNRGGIVKGKVSFDEARYYQLRAEIKPVKDKFKENNVFYKSIKALPRPKVLLVSKEKTPLEESFSKYYTLSVLKSLPKDLSKYSAVVLNNIPASEVNDKVSVLTEYIADGNGLVVIGGKNAFDKGGYKDSSFETLLPCKVGLAEKKQEAPVNVVIAIDISGSTGAGFSSSYGERKVDVEKALALDIIKSLRDDDRIGVVVFNMFGYTKQELKEKSMINMAELEKKIKSLTNTGGTSVVSGMKEAYALMASSIGTKNIVVISDGMTQKSGSAINFAKDASIRGVKVYAVGVGANTDEEFMKKLAEAGNGYYLKPEERQRLKIIFDNKQLPPEQGSRMNLLILDSTHFITNELRLNAYVTGINFVVPKSSARALITTEQIYPVLSVWRFGLGRVACFSTDISSWAGNLFYGSNSMLFTKMVNWAIGNPARKNDFDISVRDVHLGEKAVVNIKSKNVPVIRGLSFSKINEDTYSASFIANSTGFKPFWNAFLAVNYNKEYSKIGMNKELYNIVELSGGRVFDKDNISEIMEFVKENSKRKKTEVIFFRWPFVLIALSLLLVEIIFRRIKNI